MTAVIDDVAPSTSRDQRNAESALWRLVAIAVPRGGLIVLTGQSGVGKTTIAKKLLDRPLTAYHCMTTGPLTVADSTDLVVIDEFKSGAAEVTGQIESLIERGAVVVVISQEMPELPKSLADKMTAQMEVMGEVFLVHWPYRG